MAFFIFSDLFRDDNEKYAVIVPNSEDEFESASRGAVLRKTMPSKRLIDQTDPHKYVNSDHTDITRWWRQ